ncbi:MAG: diguanylate cyclase, partial [Nitrospirae bacterium]|nr:diguanylate cyclase [Nitrospirota bacterium]
MKAPGRLTVIYFIGIGLLVLIVILSSLSIRDIYFSAERVSETLSGADKLIEIESARKRAYVFFSIALILSFIGIFTIVAFYMRGISRPLQRISSATKKMAEGEFEELPVSGGDEIGTLAENFNLMGRALKDKIRELEGAIQKEQYHVRTLNILNELSSFMASKLDLDEIMENLINSGKNLIKSEFSAILLIDKFNREVSHFRSSSAITLDNFNKMASDLIKEALNKGMPLKLTDPMRDPRLAAIVEGGLLLRNMLIVPIIVEGEIIGEFILANRIGAEEFTPEDEDLALMFSFQAAVAIRKAFLHEEILKLAKTDGLTGLNNHRTFHEQLEVEIKRARRYGRTLSLLMIDIDYFKKFNDTYGHQAGDNALKGLADILLKNLRGMDSAARYGGEEFAVILFETPLEGALKTAERIRNETARHTFNLESKEVHLTVSVGVSTFPDDAMDREGLIKAADDALYMAK